MVKGARYLTLTDIRAELHCGMRWVSPYLECGETSVRPGEVVVVIDVDEKHGVATCKPMRYRELHACLVPARFRVDCDYTGDYELVIPTQALMDSRVPQHLVPDRFVKKSDLEHEIMNEMIGDGSEYGCDLIRCPSCNSVFLLFQSDDRGEPIVVPDANNLFEFSCVRRDEPFACLRCGRPFMEEENWEGKTYPDERTSVYEERMRVANQRWLAFYRLDEFRVPWESLKGSDWAKWIVEPNAALDEVSVTVRARQQA